MADIDFKRLARLGAVARLEQLAEERAAILASFPDLRRRVSRSNGDEASRLRSSAPRSKRAMSAAARKAVSVRMKKYWAERRKANAAAK